MTAAASCLHWWLHCWHGTENIRPSDPPTREEVCCRCDRRQFVPAVKEVPASAHGPFLPKKGSKP